MRNCVWCLLAVVWAIPGRADSAAFSDGSFESPVVASRHHFADGETFGPWNAVVPSSSQVDLVPGLSAGISPFDGNQYVDFSGSNVPADASVYQDFDTVAGDAYHVSFEVGRSGPGSGNVGLAATATFDPNGTNQALGGVNGAGSQTIGDWLGYSFDFVAVGPSTRLSFADASASTLSVAVDLDAVSVSVAPEPSACILPAAAALAALARRRVLRK